MTASAKKPRKTKIDPGAPKSLTTLQEQFCQLVTSGMPGMTFTRAYAEAYGRKLDTSAERSQVNNDAWRLRQVPAVAARIQELSDQRGDRLVADANRVLRELMSVVTSNGQDLVDETGALVPLTDLPRNVTAAIASVERDEYGKVKVRFWDKNAAAATLLRAIGGFEKDNQQRSDALQELAKAITGAVVGPKGIDMGEGDAD